MKERGAGEKEREKGEGGLEGRGGGTLPACSVHNRRAAEHVLASVHFLALHSNYSGPLSSVLHRLEVLMSPRLSVPDMNGLRTGEGEV